MWQIVRNKIPWHPFCRILKCNVNRHFMMQHPGGFQDVASPLFIVAHSRAFEALYGKFWTSKLMVGQCCKIDLRCVNFMCALSLRLQTRATFSSPTIK
jgi:hypothetical protein